MFFTFWSVFSGLKKGAQNGQKRVDFTTFLHFSTRGKADDFAKNEPFFQKFAKSEKSGQNRDFWVTGQNHFCKSQKIGLFWGSQKWSLFGGSPRRSNPESPKSDCFRSLNFHSPQNRSKSGPKTDLIFGPPKKCKV